MTCCTQRRKFEAVEVAAVGKRGKRSRIDRKNRIIRNVKVLGLRSKNTGRALGLPRGEFGDAVDRPYRYSQNALVDARKKYEGARVFVNHPSITGASGERDTGERSLNDLFGRLVNVRLADDGLRADLEYVASHPLAEQVIETAERMPEHLGLSHHAMVAPRLEEGEIVIDRIDDVRSVDLLGDQAGTNSGLFESAHTRSRRPSALRPRPSADRRRRLAALADRIERLEKRDVQRSSGPAQTSAFESFTRENQPADGQRLAREVAGKPEADGEQLAAELRGDGARLVMEALGDDDRAISQRLGIPLNWIRECRRELESDGVFSSGPGSDRMLRCLSSRAKRESKTAEATEAAACCDGGAAFAANVKD